MDAPRDTDPLDLLSEHFMRRTIDWLGYFDRERLLALGPSPEKPNGKSSILRIERGASDQDKDFAARMQRRGLLEIFPGRYGSEAEYELTDYGVAVTRRLAKARADKEAT